MMKSLNVWYLVEIKAKKQSPVIHRHDRSAVMSSYQLRFINPKVA